jgi:hypothetical protein
MLLGWIMIVYCRQQTPFCNVKSFDACNNYWTWKTVKYLKKELDKIKYLGHTKFVLRYIHELI